MLHKWYKFHSESVLNFMIQFTRYACKNSFLRNAHLIKSNASIYCLNNCNTNYTYVLIMTCKFVSLNIVSKKLWSFIKCTLSLEKRKSLKTNNDIKTIFVNYDCYYNRTQWLKMRGICTYTNTNTICKIVGVYILIFILHTHVHSAVFWLNSQILLTNSHPLVKRFGFASFKYFESGTLVSPLTLYYSFSSISHRSTIHFIC